MGQQQSGRLHGQNRLESSVDSQGETQVQNIETVISQAFKLDFEGESVCCFNDSNKIRIFKKRKGYSATASSKLQRLQKDSFDFDRVAINTQLLSKQRNRNLSPSLSENINYYKQRIALQKDSHSQSIGQHQKGEQSSNYLLRILHFEVYNKKTAELIYPTEERSQQQKQAQGRLFEVGCALFSSQQPFRPAATSVKQNSRDIFEFKFYHEIYLHTLEKQIEFRKHHKEHFREKELWSILYSCAVSAKLMKESGLKEPMLSPASIMISDENEVKVGEWEFVGHYSTGDRQSERQSCEQPYFIEEGEQPLSYLESTLEFDRKNMGHDIEIIGAYYWPPEGLTEVHNATRLGSISENSQTRRAAPPKNSQVFSLGLTLLHMMALKPFYQKSTFSEKQLKRIITQCLNLRQSQRHPISKQLANLLQRMIVWDTTERISYSGILEFIQTEYIPNDSTFRSQSISQENVSSDSNDAFSFEKMLTQKQDSFDVNQQLYRKKPVSGKPQKNNQRSIFTQIDSEALKSNREPQAECKKPLNNSKFILEQAKRTNQNTFRNNSNFEEAYLDGTGKIQMGDGDFYDPDPEPLSTLITPRPPNFSKCKSLAPDQQDFSNCLLSVLKCNQGELQCPDHNDLNKKSTSKQKNLTADHESEQNLKASSAVTPICEFNTNNFYNIQDSRSQQSDNQKQHQEQHSMSHAKDSGDLRDANKTVEAQPNPHGQQSGSDSAQCGFKNQKGLISVSFSDDDYTSKTFSEDNERPALGQIRSFLNSNQPEQTVSFRKGLESELLPAKKLSRDQLMKRQTEHQKQNIGYHTNRSQQSDGQAHKAERAGVFTMKPLGLSIYGEPIKESDKNDYLYTDPSLMEMVRSINRSHSHSRNHMSLSRTSHLLKSYTLNQQISPFDDFQGSKTNNLHTKQCPSQNTKNCKEESCFVIEEFSKGKYEGQKLNNLRNGYGVFYYKEGGRYEGYWENNKMQGKGTLYYSDGTVAYEGFWAEDALHGKGTLYNEQSHVLASKGRQSIQNPQPYDYRNFEECQIDQLWEKYDGWFQNDEKSGFGQLYLSNGEKFIGEFKNDMVHGKGKFHRLSGEVIEGRWVENIYQDSIF